MQSLAMKSWPWLLPQPPVLASGSATRAALLRAAGIAVDIIHPGVDERAVEALLRAAGFCQADRALALARAKTMAVAANHRDRVVIGADQTLDASGHPGRKARDRQEAAQFLRLLAGRAHRLHTAWCVAIHGIVVRESVETAILQMRALDDRYIEAYLDAVGDAALQSVGCYQIESLGQHLFEKIEGDHSVILGLPMLGLMNFLRRKGMIAA